MTIKQNRNSGAQLWSFYEGTTSLKYFYVRNISTANLIADRRYLLQYTSITTSGGVKALLNSVDVCQLHMKSLSVVLHGFWCVICSVCPCMGMHEGSRLVLK